jgi:hypothetical protein
MLSFHQQVPVGFLQDGTSFPVSAHHARSITTWHMLQLLDGAVIGDGKQLRRVRRRTGKLVAMARVLSTCQHNRPMMRYLRARFQRWHRLHRAHRGRLSCRRTEVARQAGISLGTFSGPSRRCNQRDAKTYIPARGALAVALEIVGCFGTRKKAGNASSTDRAGGRLSKPGELHCGRAQDWPCGSFTPPRYRKAGQAGT